MRERKGVEWQKADDTRVLLFGIQEHISICSNIKYLQGFRNLLQKYSVKIYAKSNNDDNNDGVDYKINNKKSTENINYNFNYTNKRETKTKKLLKRKRIMMMIMIMMIARKR